MVLDRDKLKKLLKEKGVKSLNDFNAFAFEKIALSNGFELFTTASRI